ncbi:hypothetical protein [Gracilimonas sp.]|uniref:hypothetical protein n=1 Tax=Gracilimonas sp. TaxID=1974203 RepID=UPI002871B0B5|nr:hypothetical protein [Gracilimonas sp.]
MDISNKDKKSVIESELKSLYRQQYQLELAVKVLKKTEQENQLEARTNMLIKTEAMIDAYEEELEQINED